MTLSSLREQLNVPFSPIFRQVDDYLTNGPDKSTRKLLVDESTTLLYRSYFMRVYKWTSMLNVVHVQAWKLQNNSAFPSEKCRKDLPVRHYFCLSSPNRQRVIFIITAFPLEKCLKFLLVRLHFYLSRTGGQSVISIPVQVEYSTKDRTRFSKLEIVRTAITNSTKKCGVLVEQCLT